MKTAAVHCTADAERVVEQYGDMLFQICLVMLRNPGDAEDAVQDTLIKYLQKAPDFKSADHEKAWLITTARNHCRDMHRQWWRRKTTGLSEQASAASSAAYEPGILAAAFMALPPNQRILLYLHYYEGYKLSEIAAMLRLNLNTVKTRIRCARQRLRLELEEDSDDEERT